MNNLIFCPVGIPLGYHPAYDNDNHWRYTTDKRNYKTVVYQYNDHEIDPNTYDHIEKHSGFKWSLVKHFLQNYDWSKYEYVGFFDDDLVTDVWSINRALEIAKKNNLKIFQLSTIAGSDSSHFILHQDNLMSYSITNFVEGMGPFIHSSLLPDLLRFWDFHEVKSGYGFDMILSPMLLSKAAVIHEVSMYHPGKPSYYDRNEAHKEMYEVLYNKYPRYMKVVHGMDVEPYTNGSTMYEFTLRGN